MSDLLPCIVTPCPIWVHRHGPPCRVDVNWWHQVRDYHEDETRLLKRRERFSEHVENTAWKSDYREITLSESGWIQVHGTRTLILFLELRRIAVFSLKVNKTNLSLAIWQPCLIPLLRLIQTNVSLSSSLSPLSFTPRSFCTSRSLGQLPVGLCLALSSFTSPFYSLRSFPNTAHLIIIIIQTSQN